jgi:hypothetical protein
MIQQQPSWIEHRALLDEAINHYKTVKENSGKMMLFGEIQRNLGMIKRKFEKVEKQCLTNVLQDADVVVCFLTLSIGLIVIAMHIAFNVSSFITTVDVIVIVMT